MLAHFAPQIAGAAGRLAIIMRGPLIDLACACFAFALSPFPAIITAMFYLTPNTILVCTATRGPIEAYPCRIAPRDR